MRSPLGPIFAFLDTQVWTTTGFNFQVSDLKRLRMLVESGDIRLITTSVTDREIDAGLRTKASAVAVKLSDIKKDTGGMMSLLESFLTGIRHFEEKDVTEAFLLAYSDYRDSVNPEVVDISNVRVEPILDAYFSKKPPFGEGKKKDEFPDAIAAAALESWCEWSHQELHVVTKDGDWRSLCEDCENFAYHENLSDLLAIFPDPVRAALIRDALKGNVKLIIERIKEEFPYRAFYLEAVDGEVYGVNVTEVGCLVFRVLDLCAVSAVVRVDCNVRFRAKVSYKDPDSWIWDSEDKVALYLNSITEARDFEHELSVEVSVSFSAGEEQALAIKEVVLPPDDVWLIADEYEY